jgi:DNA-binding transcriptional LysR family regulator
MTSYPTVGESFDRRGEGQSFGRSAMRKKHVSWKEDRTHLHKLRSFCLAAQTGSFSKAAELAGQSQPTVSLQIQALEWELQTVLFQRRGPRISLTPDGQALYDLAWPLVNALDSLPETFQSGRSGHAAGWLDIAAGESTILYILPDFMKEYAARHPAVELKLHNVSGREGLRLLRNDAIDFAVGSMIEVPDDIAYHPTFTYDPMLIMPLGHPLAGKADVTIREIAQYPLILPPHHLTTWRVVDFVFQKHNLNYRVALEAGGWEVIKKYVECGLGISIVTSICLKGNEALAAIKLNRYFPKRTYGVVLRKQKPLSAQATRFIELMNEHGRARGRPCRGAAAP